MIFNISGCSGCLFFLLLFLAIAFIFKFWFLIIIFILIILYLDKIQAFLAQFSKENKQKEFAAKPGKVYKQCEVCGTKAERDAEYCSKCKNPFEG